MSPASERPPLLHALHVLTVQLLVVDLLAPSAVLPGNRFCATLLEALAAKLPHCPVNPQPHPNPNLNPNPNPDQVTQCSFYPELNFLVSSSLDGTIKVGDLERRSKSNIRQLGEIDKHGMSKGIYQFEWSNLFKVLASCGLERAISIWNPYSRSGCKPMVQLMGHTSSVQHVTMNEVRVRVSSG